jgi:hypothetical protein
MAQISIGATLLWFQSLAGRHYGRRGEIEQALADLSCHLWRGAGVAVPEPDRAGTVWLAGGRAALGAGLVSSMLVLLLGLGVFALIALDWPDAAAGLLVTSSIAVLGSLLVLPGVAMIDHGRRLLVQVPLDLSTSVVSARNPRAGRLLKLAGVALGGLALAVAIASAVMVIAAEPSARLRMPMLPALPAPIAGALAILTLGTGLVVGGIALYRRGQAMLQPSVDELRVADRRRPVLLLRSFGDEDLSIVAARTHGHAVRLARLEEAIADRLRLFGPLVAIGSPGEALPTLGAARSYHSDMEWRWAVGGLMREALLIVMVAGLTAGLRWEIEAIVGDGHLSKLLILMPPSDRQRRWEVVLEELQDVAALGQLPRAVPDGLLCLHAAGGEWSMLTGDSDWEADYEAAIDLAVYGICCR